MRPKLTAAALIASFFFLVTLRGTAQNVSEYKAKLIVFEGKKAESNDVFLSVETDGIRFRSKSKNGEPRSVPFSAIESVDYTYSDRPRYTASTAAALAFGVTAFPFLFNKKKRNWLAINAGQRSSILELVSDDYRMLLMELRNKGVKISDLGDKDDLNKKARDAEKKGNNH